MHARPEVKQILISHKLRRWASIGRRPAAYPNCSPARARRNYSRLYARHEELARRLGLTSVSAYPPLKIGKRLNRRQHGTARHRRDDQHQRTLV